MAARKSTKRVHDSGIEPVNLKEFISLSFQTLGFIVLAAWSLGGWVPEIATMFVTWLKSMKD